MGTATIIGIGALPVQKTWNLLEHEMLVKAFVDAIEDAGIQKSMIDSLIFSTPRPYTEQRYFGTFIAGYLELSLDGVLMEVLGNGMTGALAFDVAVEEVQSGRAKVAVALGVSKESMVDTADHMKLTMRAVGDVDFHAPFGVTPISWYALNATRYLHDRDATREDLAAVAVKNRNHASRNSLAQYNTPITIEDVINARPIVKPLGLLDVPPRSDGAVAVVIADSEIAERYDCRPVYIRGRGFHHEGVHQISAHEESLTSFRSAEIAAQQAYEVAGLGPEDMDFAEVYAPCTIVEVILTESLGLCKPGEGAVAARNGETSLGGRIPVSTSGGCTSRGHPPMVTPLYNVYEAVQQLRRECGPRQVPEARFGIVTGELGDYNATMMHILSNNR